MKSCWTVLLVVLLMASTSVVVDSWTPECGGVRKLLKSKGFEFALLSPNYPGLLRLSVFFSLPLPLCVFRVVPHFFPFSRGAFFAKVPGASVLHYARTAALLHQRRRRRQNGSFPANVDTWLDRVKVY